MPDIPRAVVALAGARDHFQLPLALAEVDWLHKLVTDFYWPADRTWFSSSLGALLSGDAVSARFRRGLESTKVEISGRAMCAFALMKASPRLKLNRYKDRLLGRKAGQIARRDNAALFCYSTYASEAFKDSDSSRYRFLFQLHPHPATVKAILSEEAERMPWARSSLGAEYELSLPERDYRELCREPDLANGWVVASRYTALTLAEHGVPLEKIHIVPYGINHERFQKRLRPPPVEKSFTVLFLGSMIQRKGLSYLLEAVRMLKTKSIRVKLCGRGIIDRELLSHYRDLPIEVRVGLSSQELVHEIHQGDILVLPSLVEGFAHVILEAMSCGLPVMATSHTCAPDVIVNGMHGFIVPIRDSEAIAEKLAWAVSNRAELADMGEAASDQSRLFTWGRFRAGIRDAYKEMINARMICLE